MKPQTDGIFLRAEGVSKRVRTAAGDLEILRDVNLSVPRGEDPPGYMTIGRPPFPARERQARASWSGSIRPIAR